MKLRLVVLAWALSGNVVLWAQPAFFAGAAGGISTLSADGRTVTTSPAIAISLYKPENGPALRVFGGRHLNDYFSVEGNYGWNRNMLTLTSSVSSPEDSSFYQQSRRSSQQSLFGELLLYFRNRRSFARPYLSVGGGITRLHSSEKTIESITGTLLPAPSGFGATQPALRTAVGIDLFVKGGWAFRFTFSETIRSNPISEQLQPPGERNLAHFENLFGVVKYF